MIHIWVNKKEMTKVHWTSPLYFKVNEDLKF